MSYQRKEIPAEELSRQERVMERVRERSMSLSAPPKALVLTYGCQQNEADSEKLRGMLARMGYAFADSEREADVIILNTCAVREHAEQRVLGNLGALTHAKRDKPEQLVALCGCMAQESGVVERLKASYRNVGLVFGPHALWRFPELLERALDGRERVFDVDASEGAIAEGLPVLRDGGVKAWLSVMYGCNNFCSYCIVPYVRGRERSRRPDDIIREAEELVRSGVRDITLLGQNVNSYGKDLGSETDFSELIRSINGIPGDFLIRFMTSHPKDAGERLFSVMAECGKAAHQLHLPFQSGSSRVLRAMNRHYSREDYLALIDKARSAMPDVTITSDVIVGFPGETEEEFEETLSLVEEVRFDALFTFIYSKRTGTPAASMPDPFTRADKQRRFDRLVALQNRISSEKHSALIGSVQRVLADGVDGDVLTGRTNGGRLVRFCGERDLIGSFVNIRITGSSTWALAGELYPCGQSGAAGHPQKAAEE